MHVWVWYPNPAGLFSATNPLVAPFDDADHSSWHYQHGA
jgi:hypothetical protein